MRVYIAGMDGYLGWTLTIYLLARGYTVGGCDLMLRREWVEEMGSQSVTPIASMEERIRACEEVFGRKPIFYFGDLRNPEFVLNSIKEFKPDAIVHLGEMPSAPYSMIDVHHTTFTQVNNLVGTLNLLYAIKAVSKDIHLVKLGCYDDKTEVLTDKGWKLFKDLDYSDKVCSLDGETGEVSFYHPNYIVEYPYAGEMLRIVNDDVDFVITPNHRVVFKESLSGVVQIKRADHVAKKSNFVIPQMDSQTKVTSSDMEWVPYAGKVYCCTVPTGIIYVRRNGKAAWSGNTMGEYGVTNLDIPEGFFEVEYRGRKDTLPFPCQPPSFYHCTKVHDSVNIRFACDVWGLRSTDIMQGVVYGIQIPEMKGDERLITRYDVDECFPPDTKITCSEGVKPIKDVRVGDEVLTHKGRFRKVLKKFEREYVGEVIEIELERAFGKIVCTPGHPILVTTLSSAHGEETTQWMTARELKEWFQVQANPFLEKYKRFNRLVVNGASIIDVVDLSYPTYLHSGTFDRKYNLVRVTSVSSKMYKGKVYNLHVEEDHTYVANNVQVHNCFGTLVNRACAQAIVGIPLTVYGKGKQKRGFLPIQDSMQCFHIAIENPPKEGEYRVFNQFEDVYEIIWLARLVKKEAEELGFDVKLAHYENPRVEAEDHYYNPDRNNLPKLGYKPTANPAAVIRNILTNLIKYKHRIIREKIIPEIRWSGDKNKCKIITVEE